MTAQIVPIEELRMRARRILGEQLRGGVALEEKPREITALKNRVVRSLARMEAISSAEVVRITLRHLLEQYEAQEF